MPEVVERYWTPEDVRALPEDGNRYECIDGVLLVTPAPSFDHADVVMRIIGLLEPFVRSLRPSRLYTAPADVEIWPRSLVQPDVFVARPKAGLTRARRPADIDSLLLAIEVLSPSTARRDRGIKREFYQRAGAEEYWIVDPESRVIERWCPTDARPEVILGRLQWHPTGAVGPLEIDLPALFTEALGA